MLSFSYQELETRHVTRKTKKKKKKKKNQTLTVYARSLVEFIVEFS